MEARGVLQCASVQFSRLMWQANLSQQAVVVHHHVPPLRQSR